ncbi:hypothetical protein DSL72_003084 [Monilinia vaccinii-corymbosi]|uniref:Protein kinase domain-containing protein n=1 Tax=Monilinia vaccinii-corymbosi TaxID=61207 RepID=A0A8A3P079_9HELO|nr:hypothetical protein DSL72_003084 [Monilinia vaccinii-corymbosi]
MNKKISEPERAIRKVRLPIYKKNCKKLDLDFNYQYNFNPKWVDSIQKLFSTDQESADRKNFRNLDIVLNVDGSAENYFQSQPASSRSAMLITRTELFALGSIVYEITSSHQLFHELDESVDNEWAIQRLIAIGGDFPEDLWNLPTTLRILVCLCSGFIQEQKKRDVGWLSYETNEGEGGESES